MENQNNSSGIGLGGAVFIVFLVLKLTGNIDWSWWWVTCPLWAVLAIFLGVACFGLVLLAIVGIIGAFKPLFPKR